MWQPTRQGTVVVELATRLNGSWVICGMAVVEMCIRDRYYCTAPAKQLPKRLREVKYSICSVSFDPDSGSFGETIDTIYTAHNKSASFPRISPDNQYLLFTESDYATFPIWHKEADLKMISLQDSASVNTDILNSPDVESYHSWSSNGKWIIFSSRRLDGLYTRFFIAHLNKNGKLDVYKRQPECRVHHRHPFYFHVLAFAEIDQFRTVGNTSQLQLILDHP